MVYQEMATDLRGQGKGVQQQWQVNVKQESAPSGRFTTAILYNVWEGMVGINCYSQLLYSTWETEATYLTRMRGTRESKQEYQWRLQV